jgi:hypothetical protein
LGFLIEVRRTAGAGVVVSPAVLRTSALTVSISMPPEWELSAALVNWAVNPGGARALVEGYRARAGAPPRLRIETFRGAATGLQNYVAGQVHLALNASGEEEQRDTERTVRHLLTHLPSRATYEQLLNATLAET